ncbi:MAG: BON domain-containing protein [Dongiaceae bacterium]
MTNVLKTASAAFVLLSALALGACSSSHNMSAATDSAINSRVQTALMQDRELDQDSNYPGMHIYPTTDSHIVSLHGYVDTPTQVARAETVAGTVVGVARVDNYLLVR